MIINDYHNMIIKPPARIVFKDLETGKERTGIINGDFTAYFGRGRILADPVGDPIEINTMGWTLLTDPPKESGRYIVAHRGHAEIITYLNPDEEWMPGTTTGWQKNPRIFGATHYMKLPVISDEESRVAESDLKARGMTRVDEDAFNAYIRSRRRTRRPRIAPKESRFERFLDKVKW